MTLGGLHILFLLFFAGATVAQQVQCGFGVVIAEVAGEEECFSRAVNVVPEWGYPAPKGTSGTWEHRGCWTDSAGTRTLAGGSVQDMEQTMEKCVATAKQFGFRYAGIEYASRGFSFDLSFLFCFYEQQQLTAARWE